jgi:hypothetical protein
MMVTREPIIVNSAADRLITNIAILPGTDDSKSSAFVPIVGSDRMLGLIVLENYERENAYGEADVRLIWASFARLVAEADPGCLYKKGLVADCERRS